MSSVLTTTDHMAVVDDMIVYDEGKRADPEILKALLNEVMPEWRDVYDRITEAGRADRSSVRTCDKRIWNSRRSTAPEWIREYKANPDSEAALKPFSYIVYEPKPSEVWEGAGASLSDAILPIKVSTTHGRKTVGPITPTFLPYTTD